MPSLCPSVAMVPNTPLSEPDVHVCRGRGNRWSRAARASLSFMVPPRLPWTEVAAVSSILSRGYTAYRPRALPRGTATPSAMLWPAAAASAVASSSAAPLGPPPLARHHAITLVTAPVILAMVRWRVAGVLVRGAGAPIVSVSANKWRFEGGGREERDCRAFTTC